MGLAYVLLRKEVILLQTERQRVKHALAAQEAEEEAIQQENRALVLDRESKQRQHIVNESPELRALQHFIHVSCQAAFSPAKSFTRKLSSHHHDWYRIHQIPCSARKEVACSGEGLSALQAVKPFMTFLKGS